MGVLSEHRISTSVQCWSCYVVLLRGKNKIHSCLLLFQDPHAEEFEDKEWTFVIENVSELFFLILEVLIFILLNQMWYKGHMVHHNEIVT